MTELHVSAGYSACRSVLSRRLAEGAPTRIQLLVGPRQVGKTTLLLDLAAALGPTAVYFAADSPEASLPGSWERVWQRAAETAREHGRVILLIDEIQGVADWPARLKSEWDRARRARVPWHVVATGSSTPLLTTGSRERLTGRFERLTLSHWPARELAAAFGIPADEAARMVVLEGGYPGAVPLRADPFRRAAYVREAIVEPVIGRDLLTLGTVRRPALLRQVFAVAASRPAEIVPIQSLRSDLRTTAALETIAHYLDVLAGALLVAPLEKWSARSGRARAAPPKLVVLNNALLSVGDTRGPPSPDAEPERFGAWVENACLAHAWNAGQRVTYWREAPLEVAGIFEGSWGAWAVEVMTGRFSLRDLAALLEFVRRNPRFRPLALTATPRAAEAAREAGVEALAWEEFLWSGPPGTG